MDSRTYCPLYLVVPQDDVEGAFATGDAWRAALATLSRNFGPDDGLVVSVLSHGEKLELVSELRAPASTELPASTGSPVLDDALPFVRQVRELVESDLRRLREEPAVVRAPTVVFVVGPVKQHQWLHDLPHLCVANDVSPGFRVCVGVPSNAEVAALGTPGLSTCDIFTFDPVLFPEQVNLLAEDWAGRGSRAIEDEQRPDDRTVDAVSASTPSLPAAAMGAVLALAAGEDTPTIGVPGRSGPLLGATPTDLGWPDTILDAVETDFAAIRAASCRGRSHRFANSQRQDAYAICTLDDDTIIVAVADGVSQGSLSHLAARVAVTVGTELVAKQLSDGVPASEIEWREIAQRITAGIREEANSVVGGEMPLSDAAKLMSTTLMLAMLRMVDDSIAMHGAYLGDTSAWTLKQAQFASLIPIKNVGQEVASSKVVAMPSNDELVEIGTTLLPGDAIFLMSDGVGDAMGTGTGEFPRSLAAAWASPPGLHSFGSHVDFQRKSFDDDRTVVGVWFRSP